MPRQPGADGRYRRHYRLGGRSEPLLHRLPADGADHNRSATLPDREEAFSQKTSILFKSTNVTRVIDRKRNTLVYLAISDKIIDGSPQNAISSVPIMPWNR